MHPESAAARITKSSTAEVHAKYTASLVSKRSLSCLTNNVIVIQVSWARDCSLVEEVLLYKSPWTSEHWKTEIERECRVETC